MLSNLAAQREDAEIAGQSLEWPRAYKYRVLRCTRPLRWPGRHCWQYPMDDQHLALHAELMKQIVLYVQQGNIFEIHGDLPNHLRELIVPANSQERIENRPAKRDRVQVYRSFTSLTLCRL